MTEPIEIIAGEAPKRPFASPREMALAILVAYTFCLFSTTGAIISLEILFKTLSLSFLYFAGRNSHNALSGFLAASICAAYPHFHTFSGISLETVSLVTITVIMASLPAARIDGKEQPPLLWGAALLAGLVTPLAEISWAPLFIASGSLLVIRSLKTRTKIVSTILFGLGLGTSFLLKGILKDSALLQLGAESGTPLTLSNFFHGWSPPLYALLFASLVAAIFLSKEFLSNAEAMNARRRDIGQSTFLLIAAIAGAFFPSEHNALLIIAPFSATIGTILSSGLTLFKKRFQSHLGHIAVFFVLLWAFLPSDLFETRESGTDESKKSSVGIVMLVFNDGIHEEESWGTWLTDQASGTLYLDPQKTPYQLKLTLRSALGTPRNAFLRIDDSLVWNSRIESASTEHTIRLAGVSGELDVSLSTPDGCVRPADLSDSEDKRCLAFGFEGYELASMRYALGSQIPFASGSTRPTFNEYGFSASEDWGTWTDSERAGFTLELGHRPSANIVLEVLGHFQITENSPNLIVRLLVNENEVETRSIEFGEHINPRWIIPPEAIEEDGKLEIAWIFENAMSPKELNMGEDSRKLGLAIRSITLSEK